MREIVNISLSQKANHLNTHFYNSQESYLDYKSLSRDAPVDLAVFNHAVPSLDRKYVSYSPRLMLWDMAGGFGALDESETYDESLTAKSSKLYDTYGIETWNSVPGSVEKLQISSANKPKKSDYQIAMDNLMLAPQVTVENTKYWSDYSKMIYSPKSFNILRNWQFDPVNFPQGKHRYSETPKNQTFSDFQYGVEEWQHEQFGLDYLDDKFRAFLESSDNLAGLNFTSECDSGWGGISSELLPLIKDEYLPKTTIFSWGLHNNKSMAQLKPLQFLTRVKSQLALIANSSLFIPIAIPLLPLDFFKANQQLESKLRQSSWYETGLHSLVYNTVLYSFCNTEEQTRMDEIQMSLNMGSNRNIVTSVETAFGSNDQFIDNGFTKLNYSHNLSETDSSVKNKTNHIFSRNIIISPPEDKTASDAFDESLVIDKFGQFTDLNRNHGVSLKGLTAYSNSLSFRTPDTFPTNYIPVKSQTDSVTAGLEISTGARTLLLAYKKKVSVLLRKNTDEKEDMVDQLATLAQEYEWGYEDDSDDGDLDEYY